jgi:hypothetical protein
MEKLNDTLAMTSRRMERTLEITSDTEFRLLRLEKRVQTLISLGGSDLASAGSTAGNNRCRCASQCTNDPRKQ